MLFRSLRYQLNPHFLFNTLNAISALVQVKESAKANTMIVQLSSFLRYSLDNDPIQMVSLREEIDALKLYLYIEQTRFADRLRLEFNVAKNTENTKVPSLILQPLVENAIKYAVAPSETGGKISVSATIEDQFLMVEIVDTGPGIDASNDQRTPVGIGLKNTEERLREFYNEDYELCLGNCEAGGFWVRIKLPAD